jgi:prolyl oligopeptidase
MSGPPRTRASDVHEVRFGTRVDDPYRWLEGDLHADADVKAWIEQQSAYTAGYFRSLPRLGEITRRLGAVWAFEKLGCPVRRGSRLFYESNSGTQDHNVVVMQDGVAPLPTVVLDPNAMDPEQGNVVRDWQLTRDGARLAYTLQKYGGDRRSLHFMEIDGLHSLEDRLDGLKGGGFAWHPDGDRIFYTRFESATDPGDAPTIHSAVFCHRLGEPQHNDVEVFRRAPDPPLLHIPRVSDDGRWLVVTSANGGLSKSEVRIRSLLAPDVGWRELVADAADRWTFIGGRSEALLFLTDRGAPFGAIVSFDAEAASSPAKLVVPEGGEAIRGATLAGNEIVVQYQRGLESSLRRFTAQGALVGTIQLPPLSVADQLRGDVRAPELFFRVSSMVSAPAIHRCDLETGAVSVFRAPQASWNADDYVVRQVVAASRDGTRVPVTLAHAKAAGSGAPSPTVLMAYGGFGISPDLCFWESRFAWVSLGGVFAIAHTRGGAEFGSAWADASRKAGRLDVIDDYLAAADALVDLGVTTPNQLVALGASNGGLLVAAATNARPELFAVTLCRVPVTDLLRYTRFTLGPIWIEELGDPDVEGEFHTLRAYSPLHNVRSGVTYPAMLVLTADADDRVVPAHSFKYVATLQAADIGPRPHLIRVEANAGHGEGKPAGSVIAEFADLWTFALANVGDAGASTAATE